jgi:dienelactone hydrolase
MWRYSSVLMLVVLGWAIAAPEMTPEQRRQYRDQLMQILPEVPAGRGGQQSFADWIKATDALPPDFDALPKVNGLPDPFTFFDGRRKVRNQGDWKARRAEIRQLFERYVIGSMPPKPKLDKIVPVDAAEAARSSRGGALAGPPAAALAGRRGFTPAEGSVTRIVDLQYGPESQISTRVTVTIPPGAGPFPVLIGGGPNVTNNGYIACQFPSSVDAPPDIGRFYPGYDWASMAKVAWTVPMVVDYLYTLPEVDKPHIAITGYSRLGKMAAYAAAIDERIAACVAGSTGVGGVLTWRHGSERNVGESIESTTRSFPIWFKTDFRFFSGREDRLPVDGNLLAALVAPRSMLMLYGLNDEVSNTWGNEQTYYDALRVYKFLGKSDAVGILRPPGHHGANDAQATMKWLDIQFGRSTEKWTNDFLFPWDYEQWRQKSGEKTDVRRYPRHAADEIMTNVKSPADWEKKADQVRKSVAWVLGEAPPAVRSAGERVTNPGDPGIDDTPRWVIGRSSAAFGWTRQQAAGIAARDIRFGNGGIRGDLYFKEDAPPAAKLPAAIFLHGDSYPLGYMFVYREVVHPILAMAKAGYAVLAFDQTGYGSRMNEAAPFYDRNPHWSQLGRMVEDVRAAVDALQKDARIDPDKIFLFGYGTGGMVALHSAALDPRIKGVVSICGFTPMRADTADKKTGGIQRFSHERALLPRLGAFVGQETRIPYDYQDLIGAIAPRPVYVFNPIYNRDATIKDVRDAVAQARKVYGLYRAADKLVLDDPWDYFRLSSAAQDRIIQWMSQTLR